MQQHGGVIGLADNARNNDKGAAGRPAGATVASIAPWAHGFRVWLATSVALYVALWLQLASPVAAILTVAILSQPKRGQALSRALYRFAGTVAGGVVAVVLIAICGGERILLLGTFTVWLGLCVFVAAYLQGDRAYGAVLCGFTVAMIVIANIGDPQDVFTVSVERVAAITVGIAAVTLVNIGFGSPSVRSGLEIGLLAAASTTRDFARDALQQGSPQPDKVAAILGIVVGMRDEAQLIGGETTDGAHRAAGARSAIAGLSAIISASRSLAGDGQDDIAGPVRLKCLAIIEAHSTGEAATVSGRRSEAAFTGATPDIVRVRQHGADLMAAHDQLVDGLHALSTGVRPLSDAALPVHRDFPVALWDALRIMVAFAVSAAAFIASGWPATSLALSLVATLCALSALAPSATGFAMAALISLPIGVLASGLIRFVVLDGSQGFLSFVLAMAPVTFFACYLMLRKKTAGIGLLLNVFMATLLSPSNQQSYDFQLFLNTAVLSALSVVILFLTSRLVLPVSAHHRLGWILRSSRQNLADIIAGRRRTVAAQRARSDDQIAQYAMWSAAGATLPGVSLQNILVMADLAVSAAGVNTALREAKAVEAGCLARKALASANTVALEAVAERLRGNFAVVPAALQASATRAVAAMSTAARIIDAQPRSSPADTSETASGVEAVLEQIRIRSGLLFRMTRFSVAGLILLLAILSCLAIWDVYVTSPWTRDGQVRVQVARVAPQVAGEIVSVAVSDNQAVRKGDLLYVIDPSNYAIALASAVADVDSREADLLDKESRNGRRRALSTLSTSIEEKQQFDAASKMATAAVASARAQRAQAQINIRRTEVRSPVNGYVTNLLLLPGDYATAGVVNISIIDSDSYWVDGYFEETKLDRLNVGDSAVIKLMGHAAPLRGVVESVTRGISSAQAASNMQGLPNIDPVYTWVRLAQRIPIRVSLAEIPPDITLVAGMTCTVTVIEPSGGGGGWLNWIMRRIWS